MSRTERKDYRGRCIRDGYWGKKCQAPNCKTCGKEEPKRPRRRLLRKANKNGTR